MTDRAQLSSFSKASLSDAQQYFLMAMKCFRTESEKAYRADSHAEGIAYLIKSADLGLNEARYQLGVIALKGSDSQVDPDKAFEWFNLAAENGFTPASFALATLYTQWQQHEKAYEILCELAEKDITEAKTNLANLYLNGQGTDKDLTKAVSLLEDAAGQHDRLAQYQLGVLYYQGKELPTDYLKARSFIVKAMEQKYLPAYMVMGAMLEHGYGITKDVMKAYSLYFYCDLYGIPDLSDLMQDILSQMNDIDRQRARQIAKEWCENEPAPE
ncbi:tetratricopeptide repeat protein [Vibrio sp. SCSIO 43137]|uniref:tetratricopeptide repeat protein n=1 Tax=Vibrio sp. SCSIO 43137 TaxID=3021011 RepID=UPI002306EC76|nr:tetratricopeptide repeat protein [Vibrio sp. SCSIO 43137]WCE31461.1 tetratricopeptide repeat protein [Vibrio sp. SCSIO 43137]